MSLQENIRGCESCRYILSYLGFCNLITYMATNAKHREVSSHVLRIRNCGFGYFYLYLYSMILRLIGYAMWKETKRWYEKWNVEGQNPQMKLDSLIVLLKGGASLHIELFMVMHILLAFSSLLFKHRPKFYSLIVAEMFVATLFCPMLCVFSNANILGLQLYGTYLNSRERIGNTWGCSRWLFGSNIM